MCSIPSTSGKTKVVEIASLIGVFSALSKYEEWYTRIVFVIKKISLFGSWPTCIIYQHNLSLMRHVKREQSYLNTDGDGRNSFGY